MSNMETNHISMERFLKSNQTGLRSYFAKTELGNSVVYTAPFYNSKSMDQILDDWDEILVEVKSTMPGLYQFENDLRRKVGPLSVQKPLAERMDNIQSYYDSIYLESEPFTTAAFESWADEWKCIRGLRMRSKLTTVGSMQLSTNSGLPYFTKRNKVVDQTLRTEVRHNPDASLTTTLSCDGEVFPTAAVLGWRGQEAGPNNSDVKQRTVWMFPFAVNLEELRVYQSLIQACQRASLIPAWVSLDRVDYTMDQLFRSKDDNQLVVCTDFELFDNHFNPTLQGVARQALAYLFTNDAKFESWITNIFPIKYDIPLAINYGEICIGKHGMGSGSGGTNADESLAHRFLQHEVAAIHNQKLNRFSMCLGDDGLLTFPGINAELVTRQYKLHGLSMNEDKQFESYDEATYLRRWYSAKYRPDGITRGVYSTFRALGRLRYIERFMNPDVWDSKAVALRQWSILENVRWHPLAEKFVDYCMKGDKFRLGLDIPGFMDGVSKTVQEKQALMPDFLGYTRSNMDTPGITNWWIYKYLKSKL